MAQIAGEQAIIHGAAMPLRDTGIQEQRAIAGAAGTQMPWQRAANPEREPDREKVVWAKMAL